MKSLPSCMNSVYSRKSLFFMFFVGTAWYRGYQWYPYSHNDLDWGIQSWNYNCATQTVGNRHQILAPFLVYCKLARNSRKTFSAEKVSALHLKGKQFLSNVYEAAYLSKSLIWQWQHMPDNTRFSSPLSIVLLKK